MQSQERSISSFLESLQPDDHFFLALALKSPAKMTRIMTLVAHAVRRSERGLVLAFLLTPFEQESSTDVSMIFSMIHGLQITIQYICAGIKISSFHLPNFRHIFKEGGLLQL
jgi:hypothetical protein